MALVSEILFQGLMRLTQNRPSSASEAAARMADTYFQYALGAQGGGLPPIFTGTEKERLRLALEAQMSNVRGTLQTAAMAWTAGLTAFWLAPPVVFGAGSVVGTVPPLPTTLVPAFSALPPAQVAISPVRLVATVLDAATRSVQVLIPPGSAVSLV